MLRPVLTVLLIFLTGTCLAQGADSERPTAATARFSVEYPPGEGWQVGISARQIFTEEDPFDGSEESIEFRRSTRVGDAVEPKSQIEISARRQWPTIDECLVRPQDTRNQREALRRMERVFKDIREGESRMFVKNLEQCAASVEDFVVIHFAHAEFIFREAVGMTIGGKANVLEKGKTIVNDRTIHFVRFESVDRSTMERFESSQFVYFPPTFGVDDLIYFEVMTSMFCDSRASCAALGDSKAPSLAVIGSLELFTGEGQRPVSREQAQAEMYFVAKLLAERGAKFQRFGETVSVSNDVIAAIDSCGLPACAGTGATHVFVYDDDADAWQQQARIAAAPGRGYVRSVQIVDDRIVIVGSEGVYVTSQLGDPDRWSPLTRLSGSGSEAAFDGDTVVIGDAFTDCVQTSILCAGAAYVYRKDPGTQDWSETAKLQASHPPPPYLFGSAVAVDGATLAVGAPGMTTKTGGRWGSYEGLDSGAVFVFSRDEVGQDWKPTAILTPDDSAPRDKFGGSIAVEGDTLVVGAVGNKTPGAVYVFVRDMASGDWIQRQTLAPDIINESSWLMNHFGAAVAIDGDTLVVGAPYESGLRQSTGSVYVFQRNDATGRWEQQVKLKAPDAEARDNFGWSVAVYGTTIVAGSPNDSDNGQSSGSIYVFSIAGADTAEP